MRETKHVAQNDLHNTHTKHIIIFSFSSPPEVTDFQIPQPMDSSQRGRTYDSTFTHHWSSNYFDLMTVGLYFLLFRQIPH